MLQDDEDGSGSDYDEHAALGVEVTSDRRRKTQSNKDGFEIVPVSEPGETITGSRLVRPWPSIRSAAACVAITLRE